MKKEHEKSSEKSRRSWQGVDGERTNKCFKHTRSKGSVRDIEMFFEKERVIY